MPLPDTIPLRYTEDDAGYMSLRPVIKQTFRPQELVDMVVSVTGKDARRIQQILRGGTVVYHGYRYWWDALSTDLLEIEKLIAPFPDDDPSRPFVPEQATAALFETGGGTQRVVTEILRQDADQRRFLAKESPWDVMLARARSQPPRYEKFDYSRKADLFRISLPFDQAEQLLAALLAVAPRKLKYRWSTLRPPAVVTFVCPR